eukprot:5478704-Pleurochrysis_carterae.AAC.2
MAPNRAASTKEAASISLLLGELQNTPPPLFDRVAADSCSSSLAATPAHCSSRTSHPSHSVPVLAKLSSRARARA